MEKSIDFGINSTRKTSLVYCLRLDSVVGNKSHVPACAGVARNKMALERREMMMLLLFWGGAGCKGPDRLEGRCPEERDLVGRMGRGDPYARGPR